MVGENEEDMGLWTHGVTFSLTNIYRLCAQHWRYEANAITPTLQTPNAGDMKSSMSRDPWVHVLVGRRMGKAVS